MKIKLENKNGNVVLEREYADYVHDGLNKLIKEVINENINLRNVRFNNSFIDNVQFKDKYFTGSDFRGMSLTSCTFENCNLTLVNFYQCFLYNCKFINCEINSDISYSTGDTIIFENCNILKTNIDFCDFADLKFKDCKFYDFDISYSSLSRVFSLVNCEFFYKSIFQTSTISNFKINNIDTKKIYFHNVEIDKCEQEFIKDKLLLQKLPFTMGRIIGWSVTDDNDIIKLEIDNGVRRKIVIDDTFGCEHARIIEILNADGTISNKKEIKYKEQTYKLGDEIISNKYSEEIGVMDNPGILFYNDINDIPLYNFEKNSEC